MPYHFSVAIDRETLPFQRDRWFPVSQLARDLLAGNLEGAWLVIDPGVTEETAALHSRSGFARAFSGRGPAIPSATITVSEIGDESGHGFRADLGIEHGTGPGATELLGERGSTIPESLRVIQDHAKRGLVMAAEPSTEPDLLVEFALEAIQALTRVPLLDEWFATVTRRGRG